jgi:hypothetical protein
MEEAITILEAVGREFDLGAELRHMTTHSRLAERLTGEIPSVGLILNWMETAVNDLVELADVFYPSSQTAAHFRHRAIRMRTYVDRLRALGFLPTDPLSIHEPAADMGRD